MFKETIRLLALIYKESPLEVLLVCMCLVVASLVEAIGVSAIFPVLSFMLDFEAELPDSWLADLIQSMKSVGIYWLVALIIGAFIVKSLILQLAYTIIAKNVSGYSHRLRYLFIEAMIGANIHFIQSKALGENLSVLTNDSVRAAAAYISAARVFAGVLQCVLYAAYALWLSFYAMALSAVAMCLLVVSVKRTLGKTRTAGRTTTKYMHDISKNMGAALRGVKAAKAMGEERFVYDRLLNDSNKLRQAHQINIVAGQTLRNIQDPVLVASALLCVLLFKNVLLMEAGYIIFVLAIYYRLMGSVNTLQADYQKFIGQESALWSILNSTEQAKQKKELINNGVLPPEGVHDILFDNVLHQYGEKEVFSNFSARIPANALTVIKGESGRGKTTIIDMICMLVRPQEGRVFVGDVSLQEIDNQKWRHKIGYVDQFPFLFKGTIRENIMLDRVNDYKDSEILDCLADCNLKGFIDGLSKGLDYELNEGGENISGGQRQRLAIARAILNKPEYLILDEPTSALDHESEMKIFQTLKGLSEKMSVIVVSHSMGFDNYADYIIDLNDEG